MQSAGSEVEQRVLAGGRYLIFQYCISILVMSFRRSSGIVYVPPGKDGASAAITNSLISLLVGWWGIPWGPIWTISTVFKNARGGTDVTQEVLAAEVGAMRAANLMARRRMVPAATGTGMKIFRVGAAIVGLWVLFTLGMIVWGVAKGVQEGMGETKSPPASVSQVGGFQGADHNISINRGTVAFGNSPQAVAVAAEFAKNMKLLREALFEKGKTSVFSATKHEFITHCELREGSCVILVHVPELRKFTAEAQTAMGELAWANAQVALEKNGIGKPGMKLGVGLRGAFLYDRVLLGVLPADDKDEKEGLAQTITSSSPEKALYSFFP
jgi:hypothetical protein